MFFNCQMQLRCWCKSNTVESWIIKAGIFLFMQLFLWNIFSYYPQTIKLLTIRKENKLHKIEKRWSTLQNCLLRHSRSRCVSLRRFNFLLLSTQFYCLKKREHKNYQHNSQFTFFWRLEINLTSSSNSSNSWWRCNRSRSFFLRLFLLQISLTKKRFRFFFDKTNKQKKLFLQQRICLADILLPHVSAVALKSFASAFPSKSQDSHSSAHAWPLFQVQPTHASCSDDCWDPADQTKCLEPFPF